MGILQLGTSSESLGSGLVFVSLEVVNEHRSDLVQRLGEFLGSALPDLTRVQKFVRDVGDLGGDLQIEDVVVDVFGVGKFTAVDSIKDSTSVLERAALGDASLATDPAGVDQPSIGLVLRHLFSQHGSIALRVEDQEGSAEACREGSLGFNDAIFGTGDLGSVARDEVVHGLLGSQLGDGRQDTKCIAGQQDNVLGVAAHAGNLSVGNVVCNISSSLEIPSSFSFLSLL